MAKPRQHIALVPGLFGFAKLGGFDFGLVKEMRQEGGIDLTILRCPDP